MKYGEPKITGGKCLCCGRPLYGRVGKRFCNTTCKNRYNNGKVALARQERASMARILDTNYRILRDVLILGQTAISLKEAIAMGFTPEACTSFRLIDYRTICRCYDIEYHRTRTKLMSIRRL